MRTGGLPYRIRINDLNLNKRKKIRSFNSKEENSLKIHQGLSLVGSLVIGITLVLSGCESGEGDASYSKVIGPAAVDSVATNLASTNTIMTNSASTNRFSAVLNDDPNCDLVLKYQNRDIDNDGQVHYVKRVLTSDPFGSANPICVQYNDTRTGEVTVWKEPNSTGRRIDKLPSDCGIDKIVVWYGD